MIVDILEKCHVWWQPPTLLMGGPKVLLHTILEIVDTPEGKKICYQYDHTMWLESLLYHNLPKLIGDFFHDTYRPVMGESGPHNLTDCIH